jgi:predicted metal-dependent hydrolase
LRASDKQIQELVQQKEQWIIAKQELARRTYAAIEPKEYVNGEGFLYLGKSHKLALVDGSQPGLTLGDQFHLSTSALPRAEAVFKAWYKQQARRSSPSEWQVRLKTALFTNARRSQAALGVVSARLVELYLAPGDGAVTVIDYVVVHSWRI